MSYRSGNGLRLIIGLIVALVGVVTYFVNTSKNPYTGETQHVGNITPDQEVQLGLNAAPEMIRQMGGEVDERSPDAAFVEATGRRLVTFIPSNGEPYKFDFHLLGDSQTVNAFALPGGQVFITRALFSRMTSEAQLAGVLGHEIGHVLARHSSEHMARQQLGQTLVVAAAVGSSDNRGAAIAQVVNNLTQLKYGRDDEREADAMGVDLMTKASLNPQAMVEVMEILAKTAGAGRQPDFLSTHPNPADRAKEIAARIAEKYPDSKNLPTGRPLHHGE